MCSIRSEIVVQKSTNSEEEQQQQEEEEQEKEDNQYRRESNQRTLIMSLHDVVQPPPSPPPPQSPPSEHHLRGPLLEEISSPINAQIFDFCNPDIFSDTLQNTEATSTSPNGCGFHEDQNYSIEHLDISKFLRDDQNEQNTSATSSTATTATTVTTPDQFQHQSVDGLSIIFDSSKDDIDDISASIDFSPSSPFSGPTNYNINYNHPTNNYNMTNQHEYQYQLHINNVTGMISSYPTSIEHAAAAAMFPLVSGPPPPGPAPLGTVFEDDCFSPSMLPFLRINPTSNSSSSSSCSFLDPSNIGSCLPAGNLNHGLAGAENSGLFPRSLLMGSELVQGKEMDFQGDNAGIFCTDHQLPRAPTYNSGDKQGFSSESSQLVSSATSSSAPLTTEMSNLEDSSFKVGKLSAEQRKEKIHRYLKKRNERNFSKKIKYACRKTLADSRPRVRGRFAKNDDFVDTHRHNINGHHEDDDYDDVAVKEEDDMVDSSDILTHISGVNSFKCNFQIQSWM